MPKNEDGEFELILGNRQLLSVFFIVVVLLGVFFAMGYVVGRNNPPAMAADASRKTDLKPIVVDRAQSPTPEASGSSSPATEPPASTQAVPDTPAPAPQTADTAPPRAKEVKPAEPAARPPVKPESASPTPDVPVAGASYLQVAAVAKAEAELFVDVLAKKGFHAMYTNVPEKPQMYRVLVGPFQDSAAIAQARGDLNKAGFKGFEALQRKY